MVAALAATGVAVQRVMHDNDFCRRVASRFLLLSGSYCLTEDVTEIRSLPHNGVTQIEEAARWSERSAQ